MSPAASTRWCPTPEQVMILEEMYRGGVRTPNATQIQQITAHLSLYGKIEGKNVFYWFQNHKARDRQKLRKRLVGKQLHQVEQHHMMFQIPSVIDIHHPPFLPPCCAPSSTLAFHHLPHYATTSPSFATLQPRSEDTFPGMTNSYARKRESMYAKFGVEYQKPATMTNVVNDCVMKQAHYYDYHRNNNDDYDDHVDDHDNDEGSTKTTLKTLQLFPIKDKTSLKKDVHICGGVHYHTRSIIHL